MWVSQVLKLKDNIEDLVPAHGMITTNLRIEEVCAFIPLSFADETSNANTAFSREGNRTTSYFLLRLGQLSQHSFLKIVQELFLVPTPHLHVYFHSFLPWSSASPGQCRVVLPSGRLSLVQNHDIVANEAQTTKLFA